MLNCILYNEIPVSSIEESIKWYQDVLGLKFEWHIKEEQLAQLNLPSGQMLFLVETNDKTTANFTKGGKPHNVVGFQTTDIKKLYNHLKQHNVTVEEIVDDGMGNMFLNFFDQDGNMFNVQCDV